MVDAGGGGGGGGCGNPLNPGAGACRRRLKSLHKAIILCLIASLRSASVSTVKFTDSCIS